MMNKVRLDSVVKDFIVPQRDKPKVFDGDIPWCRIEDFNGVYLHESKKGLCVSQEIVDLMPLRVYPKDTVLVSCSADLGKCAIVAKPLVTNQTFIGLVPSENVDSLYLYYLMGSKANQLNDMAAGATIKYLSKKKFQEINVFVPPLDQQKKIAAILDVADAYRKKTKALIEKYDELTQSLFLDMFGDPVTNPKGWEKESLYLCLQKVEKIGKDYTGENIEYVDIGSVDNIRNIITETTTYKIQERPSRAQQILLSGDIIISTVRPNLKNIALNQVDGRIGSTGFFVCRAVLNKLSNLFLFKVMLTDSVTDYFVGITSGANYPAVKSNDLKKFQVIVPPIDLQNQFAERVKAIEAQKAQAKASLVQAEDLFNSLLQRAFKGELTA